MSARREEREEKLSKGLGVDLIPQLEEFEALAVAKAVSLQYVQSPSVTQIFGGGVC